MFHFFHCRKENEYKITLFWHKIFQLSLRRADFSGSPLNEVAKQLSFLATNLHQLGEDKDSSGLLGAILPFRFPGFVSGDR
jgi:hypothetical protein